MPTATDYRLAAGTFRSHARSVSDALAVHRRHGADAIGALGPVADRHDAALGELRTRLAAVRADLEQLARMCDRRAVVCDDYRARRQWWEHLELPRRVVTPAPHPPASWVEA